MHHPPRSPRRPSPALRTLVGALVALCVLTAGTVSVGAEEVLSAPTGLSATVDAGRTAVTLTWSAPASGVPAGYLVEYQQPGVPGWYPASATLGPTTTSHTSPLVQGLYEGVTVGLRVVAVDAAGAQVPSGPLAFDVPATPLPVSTRFSAPDPAGRLVADSRRLSAAGLDTFADGLLSVAPTGQAGVYDFYASQGDRIDAATGERVGTGFGHVRGTLSDPLGEVVATRGKISNPRQGADYTGGGAVWVDTRSALRVMFYHRETYGTGADGGTDASNFYSSIGAAASWDGGTTFSDLGVVLTPDIAADSPLLAGGLALTDLSLAMKGDHLHLYYNDVLEDGTTVVAVARISEPDLRAQVGLGRTPVLKKYANGRFSEPGLGGTPSALVERGFNPSVVWSACSREFVMVATTWTGEDRSQLVVSTSPDGFSWSTPQGLYTTLPGYRIYNTLVGDTVSAQGGTVLRGSELHILTMEFASGTDFWSDAELRDVTVTDKVAVGRRCQAPVA